MSMKKAIYDTKPQALTVTKDSGTAYAQITANAEEHTAKDEEGNDYTYWEVDFNEIIGPESELPLDEIEADPESFLDYQYSAKTTEQKVADLNDAVDDLLVSFLGG